MNSEADRYWAADCFNRVMLHALRVEEGVDRRLLNEERQNAGILEASLLYSV